MLINCTLNGRDTAIEAAATTRLSALLRETLGLTGTHVACDEGVCGSCTVLLDGSAARACLTLAGQCDGVAIETVEGVAAGETFETIADAFLRHNALQCGFCTPGFVTTVAAMLRDDARERLGDAEVEARISSVACRCTGYLPIVAAVRDLLGRDR
ncbi:2Fe-2S iron-sulfur cluster binding domain-containing protein [Sphingomonas histidinilytica]|uniref:Carbon-monoxide dehydrogenase small subunit n=1 Tax=Rhizorhabdus histidinilytica TaxID=439228 RepID=A0A1T5F3G0_9SPHN|nr:2Fe-2S iron-sulfur cluster-binding protein [Rhizorhabdus histidinilytica]MBO9377218.1 2Fe-2S iron-sulfur cluster binding domain-containing protein [Rhizorhabdus histidinilytica]SKB90590.1 carbon-monoxide dehydrogenase small subunit [Rhizorhabdus histidinilytica]